MKVYKFIFFVGFLNLTIPFLGVPFVYKNYALIALAIATIAYALILRAIEIERKIAKSQKQETAFSQQKTIEDVVEMSEVVIVSDIKPKKRGRKSKVVMQQEIYE